MFQSHGNGHRILQQPGGGADPPAPPPHSSSSSSAGLVAPEHAQAPMPTAPTPTAQLLTPSSLLPGLPLGQAEAPSQPPASITAMSGGMPGVDARFGGEFDLPEPPPSSCRPQLTRQSYPSPVPNSAMDEDLMQSAALRYDQVDHLRHMGQMMWEQRAFADLSIMVEGCVVARAHRSVLAAASPRIATLLQSSDDDERRSATEATDEHGMAITEESVTLPRTEFCDDTHASGGKHVLEFHDVDPLVVDGMLRFVYTGSLPKNIDHGAVLHLAHSYGIQGLAAHCCHALASETLTANNVVEKLRALRACSDNDVAQRAYKAICDQAFTDRALFDNIMTSL